MQRNAKSLQSKSRAHTVVLIDPALSKYKVTSATSGKSYFVNVFNDGKAGCSCDWAQYHNEQGASACSHVIAVLNFRQKENWNTVAAWANEEQASKQHRMVLDIGDGVVLTIRPHRKIYTQLSFA